MSIHAEMMSSRAFSRRSRVWRSDRNEACHGGLVDADAEEAIIGTVIGLYVVQNDLGRVSTGKLRLHVPRVRVVSVSTSILILIVSPQTPIRSSP